MGAVRIDELRPITGSVHIHNNYATSPTGIFFHVSDLSGSVMTGTVKSATGFCDLGLDAGRVVPVGPAIAPRRFGVLACAWMGMPAL